MKQGASKAMRNRPMNKTNFDRYLAEQLKDPAFAARFERAGEAWDVAIAEIRRRRSPW